MQMFQAKNAKQRKRWLVLSVIVGLIALFGAMFWAPMRGEDSTLLWVIFALMAVQSYSLYEEDPQAKEAMR